jgi:glycosyltransferase involved in cell wall biosynthesis
MTNKLNIGIVAIGRNEGERLKRCLASVSSAPFIVYVDSGSSDGSQRSARDLGAQVVELDMSTLFTAARARNAGFHRLLEIAPDLPYVQFVDGDCELNESWPEHACAFLDAKADVAAVCGRRRERFPHRSIYNWLCDHEWDGPVGEVRYCGGDVMIRTQALAAVSGYRDDLIAGEEPELCVRLRQAGWRIWRLDREMTLHDAAMTRLSQWWRRAIRGGYAFAEGAYLHGGAPERHYVWDSMRISLWGFSVPLACLVAGLVFWPWGWVAFLIYPMQLVRKTANNSGSLRDRSRLALFQIVAPFAEIIGQFRFIRDCLLGRRSHLIEYK